MRVNGLVQKMHTSLKDGIAQYFIKMNDHEINMNDLIGKNISLTFTKNIICSNCGQYTKKSYSQGHCYLCSQQLASCDLCIMKPETCHFHLGTCREPEWGENNCFTPHIIYLANSSGAKVGITRMTNVPSRWIDQGAIQALPILQVDSRIKSGMIESSLKQYINDKTNWRQMLKNEVDLIDLRKIRDELTPKIADLIENTSAEMVDPVNYDISYPVIEYPTKIVSLNFDKTPNIEGIVKGIKGQYLILDIGVLNIRKFSSYELEMAVN